MNIFALFVNALATVKSVVWLAKHFFALMTVLLLGWWFMAVVAG